MFAPPKKDDCESGNSSPQYAILEQGLSSRISSRRNGRKIKKASNPLGDFIHVFSSAGNGHPVQSDRGGSERGDYREPREVLRERGGPRRALPGNPVGEENNRGPRRGR